MNPYERLRRNLHDALPTGPDFPNPLLLDRIVEGLPARGGMATRAYVRRQAWVPALAVLLVILVVAGLVTQQLQVLGTAGRVEFVGQDNMGIVEFLSSQAQPEPEYRAMTEKVLARFNGTADFNSQPTGAEDIDRILYEQKAGQTTVDLIALTHSDMLSLQRAGALEDLTPLLQRLRRDREFPTSLLDYAKFGTDEQYYIPWLQATYMIVVNKQALQYLPPGASADHLSYDQLVAWGQKMEAETGRKRIGLPADLSGPRGGLIYRFLQGYAYPSYTQTTLTGFRSTEAVQMWQTLRRLWSVTDEASAHYASVAPLLQTGEVWVAWDHQARLGQVLADTQHFEAVPAPYGPVGHGYMSAVVGLAIPRGAPNRRGAEALVDWLTRPEQQAAAAESLGFFPVVKYVRLRDVQEAELAVQRMYQADTAAVDALLPAGLGAHADEFTAVYQDAFARIVLKGEDIVAVLNEERLRLQQIVDAANASCWPPDHVSRRPCQIE